MRSNRLVGCLWVVDGTVPPCHWIVDGMLWELCRNDEICDQSEEVNWVPWSGSPMLRRQCLREYQCISERTIHFINSHTWQFKQHTHGRYNGVMNFRGTAFEVLYNAHEPTKYLPWLQLSLMRRWVERHRLAVVLGSVVIAASACLLFSAPPFWAWDHSYSLLLYLFSTSLWLKSVNHIISSF